MKASPRALAQHVAVFGAYLALWTAVSWPLAAVPILGDRVVTRQFDLYPSMWLVDAAPGTFPRMISMGSAWPFHELLTRVDSYVLLMIGWVNHGFLSGATVCALVAWLGVPISAFVAERCAGDGFNVDRPWSLIAGLCYGFSGVAATALLEGHVFHLLNPWLPLMWWGWQRALTADGVRSGLVVGVGFAGALYTSAYFGVFGLILLVFLAVDAPRVAQRVAPGVAAVALPVGLYYLWLFHLSSRFQDADATSSAYYLRMGTVAASDLLGWAQGADVSAHSLTGALPLMGIPLALGVVATGRRTRAMPLFLALFGILCALGRTWHLDPGDAGLDLPVDRFLFPALAFFRFPVRALWLTGLAIGVQAARTLGATAARAPWLSRGALLLAGVDAIVGPGLPWRTSVAVAGLPSAYNAAPAGQAVLDLWAQPADHSSGDIAMWSRNLTCYYAGLHHRPTPEVCIGTGVRSPREVLDGWLTQHVLADPADQGAAWTLTQLGIGAVAVHLDLYREGDAASLRQGLETLLGPPLAESTDAGDHLVVYGVPAGDGSGDPVAAYLKLTSGK